MRKLVIKIAVILFAVLITILAVTSTLIFLVNKGTLTSFIERQMSEKSALDIRVEGVCLSIFSGLELNNISVRGMQDRKGFTLGCDTITIQYKLFDFFKRRIKGISLSGVHIDINTAEMGTTSPLAFPGQGMPVFNIRDFYPVSLFVEDISVNNMNMMITTGDYVFTSTEMNTRVENIQATRPFGISIKGNFSVSGGKNGASSNISGKIDINTEYTLSDDELTIQEDSYLFITDFDKFSLGGKVCSLFSSPEIDCDVNSHGLPIRKIPDLLNSLKLANLSSLTLGGECDLNLSIQGSLKELRLRSNNSVEKVSIKAGNATFTADVLEIPVKAVFSPLDPAGAINADGKCVVHNGHLRSEGGQITSLDLSTIFTLDYPNQVTLLSEVINGKLHYADVSCPLNKLVSNIKTIIDLKQPESARFRTQIDTAFSDPLHITGNIDVGRGIIRDATLNIHNINGKTLSETFKSLIPINYREWAFHGSISMDTVVDYDDKSRKMTAITDLLISGIRFASPDYDYFGEGINGHIKINASSEKDFNRFSFYTDGTFEPFLIQLKAFTTDMRNRKAHFSLSSDYEVHDRLLSGIKGSLSWDDIGTITVIGDTLRLSETPYLDMNIEIKGFSNTAFFDTFMKDTVQYSNPLLFHSRIDGESNARFYLKGSQDDLSVAGDVKIKELNLEYGNINIKDMNVHFPVFITYPHSRTAKQKQDIPDSQYGSIRLGRFSCGPFVIEDIRIAPIIDANNFFIKDPLGIHVFDGTIELMDLSVEDIISQDRKIKLELQLDDINLKSVATAYKLTPFEGSLSSSAMSFQQQGRKLCSNDTIRIELFGGEITIMDLTLDNFFSPMRALGFSAEINHLDLGRMSNTYREWGDITGIINGRVKNFRLVAGEPSGFEIEMKTERYPESEQTVSARFIKNFVPGVGKVLDKIRLTNYKYEIMGLHAWLENDYVTLRGAVREGDKELFMKGAGLKKLDIVFPNVNRRVSFKTFLNSFKGILGSDFEGTRVQFK